jgi:hypothetical protein
MAIGREVSCSVNYQAYPTDCLAQKTFLSGYRFSRVVCKARQGTIDGVVRRSSRMLGR